MQKEQHITDKELRILKYFYENREGHVRKIKRSLKMPEHTLLKYLNYLVKRKILSYQKKGNLKIFELNLNNPMVMIFFSYFDILRLERLEFKRKKAIEEFLLKIKQIKLPYFILLFGSSAKGNYTKKSDIDLILVYEDTNKIKNKINELVKNIYAETGLKINFLLMEVEEFIKEKENKENYALQDAIKTGYSIFGRDLFYELVLK